MISNPKIRIVLNKSTKEINHYPGKGAQRKENRNLILDHLFVMSTQTASANFNTLLLSIDEDLGTLNISRPSSSSPSFRMTHIIA